ncbi:CHAT domain-containing protein [Methylomonas sp. MS20]|uniref:CHAT domain-containing protein n=1 Tax=unclassified Methylomonas TaxID=2608980 RepID=UPI0028A53611|nr:CHAT domain-containing protein [Methylomonas sp. MV1]MDT4332190.1 CHAT domain-containing protein [Methylomonas sp. MV1]
MSLELNLRFPKPDQVIVRLGDNETESLPFSNPITAKDRDDLRWYVEVYAAHALGDPDDREALRIKNRLPLLGKALFDAVFGQREAQRLFNEFQDARGATRLLTVGADHPAILGLPWELLHDSSAPDGTFLYHEALSIRRRYAGAAKGRPPHKIQTKDQLHLLMVVSRPQGAGFIDPRADAEAVLDAIDQHAPGRISVEFLRPATLDALLERLEDDWRPAIDILHFDGHGVFDKSGGILNKAKTAGGGHGPFKEGEAGGAPNTGYLLFEDNDGNSALLSAAQLGQNLHRQPIGLVILSACQSAAHGDGDEPLGSVAARLTAAGIPAVLAMSHSVLVPTTQALFGEFYQHLAKGRGLGAALDKARRHLDNHPEKYRLQLGERSLALNLHDWFIPTLYHAGADSPLLSAVPAAASAAEIPNDLPDRPEAGFFGRRRELWQIERGFAGQTRRISISGFGGQGKTALALEAGRWLLRTGLFRRAVFVNYAETASRDPVAVAVAALAVVLRHSLSDADAATAALRNAPPCLIILDNLESLEPDALKALLDAAQAWSEAGASRLLLTSRRPDFNHPGYPGQGSLKHIAIALGGLGSRAEPDDALAWHAQLNRLPPAPSQPPPARSTLVELFALVDFHPLSIRVLSAQLKTRRIAELGGRLEQLLNQTNPAGLDQDHPAALVASLQLSLEKLDAAARALLPRLGVFQGGAMEPDLLAISEIPTADWPALRQQLQAAALLSAENLPEVNPPFLRFHPTLAPLLWQELDQVQRDALTAAHRQQYYGLANDLYDEDKRNPHAVRAIARRELPNLLFAVRGALQAGEPQAVNFVYSLNLFLHVFGLRREQAELARLAERQAGAAGSDSWYLAQTQRGEQLWAAGQIGEAIAVFEQLLAGLGDTANYRRANTLGWLGRCFNAGGRPDLAADYQQQSLSVLAELPPSDSVQRQTGMCWIDLADALTNLGRYAEARQAYLDGLAIAEELQDLRTQGVTLLQLGTLAIREGLHDEALQRYRDALHLFQSLNEPATETAVWHQLGMVYHETRQWQDAEDCYRKSAEIKETLGDQKGAASTWNNLAQVNRSLGKPAAAETWYRKAIAQRRQDNDKLGLAINLNNLADLLQNQSKRLNEARVLAEEALALKQTLEPGAAMIWTTYHVLAEIAARQAAASGDVAVLLRQAQVNRLQAREAYRAYPGNRVFLQKYAFLILAWCDGDAATRADVLAWLGQADFTALAEALSRLQAGERDAEALLDALNYRDGLIFGTILQGLAEPASLDGLRGLPDGGSAGDG